MAKGIEINGMLRGKRGGVVYYRQGGQQISRARNFSPANPNTEKQRIQRFIMATVMQAYSFMSEICDHSFENVKYKQDSMSYFLRINASALRAKAGSDKDNTAFVAKGLQALVPNTYGISRGSLLQVPYMTAPLDVDNAFQLGDGSQEITENTPVSLQTFLDVTASQPGDMLTFVFIVPTGSDLYTEINGTETRNVLKETAFVYHRVKLKSSYTENELTQDFIGLDGVIDKSLLVESESNSDGLLIGNPADYPESGFLTVESYKDAYAFAVIRSTFNGTKWARSSADMKLRNSSLYGLSFENALVNWAGAGTDLGTGDWLLNDKQNANF